jgi:hypothetical protein
MDVFQGIDDEELVADEVLSHALRNPIQPSVPVRTTSLAIRGIMKMAPLRVVIEKSGYGTNIGLERSIHFGIPRHLL